MQAHSPDIAPKSHRAAVSNGRAFPYEVDGRSTSARRFRDLLLSYAAELGGDDAMSEAQRSLVRQAAAVTLQSETMQVAILRGDAVDVEQLVRLSNTQGRLLKALGIGQAKPAKAKDPDLREYLAQRGAAA